MTKRVSLPETLHRPLFGYRYISVDSDVRGLNLVWKALAYFGKDHLLTWQL